jgi:predicted metal-dependent hydrolase
MIAYTHKTHPKSKNLKLKIEPGGEVVVVSPKFVTKAQVESFVRQNQVWIQKHLSLQTKRTLFNKSDSHLHLFGKKYQKIIINDLKLPRGITVLGNKVQVNLPGQKQQDITSPKVNTYITRFTKNTAEEYIIPRTYQLSTIMEITFGKITLREQKTRWGSCSATGNLNFNWRLVHAPTEVIDYVIIHELAHRKQMNHSQAFWNLVAKFDPAHAQHRGWLKRQGMSVG